MLDPIFRATFLNPAASTIGTRLSLGLIGPLSPPVNESLRAPPLHDGMTRVTALPIVPLASGKRVGRRRSEWGYRGNCCHPVMVSSGQRVITDGPGPGEAEGGGASERKRPSPPPPSPAELVRLRLHPRDLVKKEGSSRDEDARYTDALVGHIGFLEHAQP